jgi:hypothetical protein
MALLSRLAMLMCMHSSSGLDVVNVCSRSHDNPATALPFGNLQAKLTNPDVFGPNGTAGAPAPPGALHAAALEVGIIVNCYGANDSCSR